MFLFPSNIPCVYASNTQTYFARIMSDDVYLYKSAYDFDDVSNIYFKLPETYFVELVGEENNFFKVNYLSFCGYVKKEQVQTIVGAPLTPYLENINFRIYSEQSRDLRIEPTLKGGANSQVAYIPLLSRNLTYYGTVVGESLIEGRTNVWFYCKYSADKDYYGYVYSDFCDEITEILPNTEQVSYTTNPNFNPKPTEPKTLPLENKTTGIIIAILSLPAAVFIMLVFKNKILVPKNNIKGKEIIDY